jgi:hypothetical protein
VEVLHRMTFLPGDVYANYDLAAALLEEKGHDAEASEFLAILAKDVPWNTAYAVRLSRARIHSNDAVNGKAVDALESATANRNAAYDVRVRAAMILREAHAGAKSPGSAELRWLASGEVAPDQAQQPYFAAARIAAADDTHDRTKRELLLRQAISIRPNGLEDVAGFAGSVLRIRIFRAEAELGHDASALNAIEPLLNGSYSEASLSGGGGDDPMVDRDTAEESSDLVPANNGERLTDLERLAPLPAKGLKNDAEKLALSVQIAQVYERGGKPASALPYLKRSAWMQKDGASRADLQRQVKQIQTTLALDTLNAQRRPEIRQGLDQSNLVRPRLTKAEEVTREEVRP